MSSSATSSVPRRAATRPGIRLSGTAGRWLGVFDAMASPCEVHLAVDDRRTAMRALRLVADEAWRIEAKYSRYRRDNIVDSINRSAGQPVRVDSETARLLDYAAELFDLSSGRFDITSGVLRRAWRFDGSDRLPAAQQVADLMKLVGWQRVRWSAPYVTLEPGMEIDFGGIGKEYAVDRAAALVEPLTTHCLLNFGGDLRALGPDRDGTAWRVGIESADRLGAASRGIDLYQGGLATSGDSRRFLVKDQRRYGHILDPVTGWPVEGAPRSVTVVAPTCTQAGMLATLAMLRGRQAEDFLANHADRYWCTR